MSDEIRETEELKRLLLEMFAQMTGPTADLIRATMAARTDGLIDAYKRMSSAGLPEFVFMPLLTAMAGGKIERKP
ncbi:MAG TPA: hypothetical protein VFP22_02875 [Candidatus Limnocylindrales bacterium]|nr:hypothetical protein [Candidatus Limnocylindrales bacterium]